MAHITNINVSTVCINLLFGSLRIRVKYVLGTIRLSLETCVRFELNKYKTTTCSRETDIRVDSVLIHVDSVLIQC